MHGCCNANSTIYSPVIMYVWLAAAGLVFFAFALNMVDCGGLLGGRLGADKAPAQVLKSAEQRAGIAPLHKRTFTL